MILVIDNYDSFVYNLAQYLGDMGADPAVYRNDRITVEDARRLKPDRLVISPGPCTPREAGVSKEMIRAFAGELPILGVCLGHQCIGEEFGGEVAAAGKLMHGKTSLVRHNGKTIFSGLPNPFEATRYHSLLVKRENLPDCLEVIADTEEGEIMGLRHKEFSIWGVQFHPESILTKEGKRLLGNFLKQR